MEPSFIKKMTGDSVLSETFSFYKNHLALLITFSLIITIFGQASMYLGNYNEILMQMQHIRKFDASYFQIILSLLPFMLIMILISVIAQVFLLHYTIQRLSGNEAHYIELFRESVKKYFLKYLLLMLLAVFIFIIGMIAGALMFGIGILFTTLYLFTILAVSAPILLIEDKSVIDTIGRSFVLTHRHFWGALGAICLFILMMVVLYIIALIASLIPYAFLFIAELIKGSGLGEIIQNKTLFETNTMTSAITGIVFSALLYPVSSIFSVFLYGKLKYTENEKLGQLNANEIPSNQGMQELQ